MHEMGVVLQLVKTAVEFSKANDIDSIKKLNLDVGEASSVLPHYVEMFWKDVVPDYPVLSGCELHIETVPAKAFCMDCGEVFHPGDRMEIIPGTHNRESVCPACGGKKFRIIEGNNMMIRSIELE